MSNMLDKPSMEEGNRKQYVELWRKLHNVEDLPAEEILFGAGATDQPHDPDTQSLEIDDGHDLGNKEPDQGNGLEH
jgi:hypothetical protein